MSWTERRLELFGDLNVIRQTVTVTIPIGGGSVPVTLTFPSFSTITGILSVQVQSTVPYVSNVFQPQANFSGNIVGMTLAAGAGTTLTASVLAIGQ